MGYCCRIYLVLPTALERHDEAHTSPTLQELAQHKHHMEPRSSPHSGNGLTEKHLPGGIAQVHGQPTCTPIDHHLAHILQAHAGR